MQEKRTNDVEAKRQAEVELEEMREKMN